LVREVFADVPETGRFEEFFDDVFDLFRTPEGWALDDDTHSTLAALAARGFHLGLISNFDSRVYDVLRAFDLARHFSTVHISSRVGAAKPDAAIFHAALAAHGIHPHEAVYVGDSLRDDARGAAAAGLRAVWLDRTDRAADFPLRIVRLTELLNLVATD
jgi:putative hydrolase of the HAD superfamily